MISLSCSALCYVPKVSIILKVAALNFIYIYIIHEIKRTSRLFPIHQVINAARTLAARPRSKVAKENMDVFRDAWINQVKVLTEAVDDITTIDDFLAVSGNLKLLEFFL